MTDDATADGRDESIDGRGDALETVASSTAKFRGEFDADAGAGVLGKNTADSGTPIGVEGAVPNASGGYGLSTPHDARVDGTAAVATLAGSLTGGQSVSDLLGPGLALSAGTLVATPARLDVDDGTTSVADVDGITFASGFAVTDDGDGTATVDRG